VDHDGLVLVVLSYGRSPFYASTAIQWELNASHCKAASDSILETLQGVAEPADDREDSGQAVRERAIGEQV
jgi:hypothetical protein